MNTQTSEDKCGFLWGMLSFFFPLVGLIMFLALRDTKPRTAKTAGTCALISVILTILFYAVTALLQGVNFILFI